MKCKISLVFLQRNCYNVRWITYIQKEGFAMKLKTLKVKDITILSMLIALHVIAAELLKFPIIPKILELSFGFVPIAVTGMLFGIVPAIIVGAVGDVIGGLIFSTGDFFFGFTLTAMLTGFFYGLFLNKPQPTNKKNLVRVVLAQALVSFICFATLNTLWAYMMGYARTSQYIITRLVVNIIAFPIYTFILYLLTRYRKTLELAVK